jgi:hypothetical protein
MSPSPVTLEVAPNTCVPPPLNDTPPVPCTVSVPSTVVEPWRSTAAASRTVTAAPLAMMKLPAIAAPSHTCSSPACTTTDPPATSGALSSATPPVTRSTPFDVSTPPGDARWAPFISITPAGLTAVFPTTLRDLAAGSPRVWVPLAPPTVSAATVAAVSYVTV